MVTTSGGAVTAGLLWARANGMSGACAGPHRCHYCAGPCDGQDRHPEPPPVLRRFRTDSPATALCPSSPYACRACLSFKNQPRTVSVLGGGLTDKQKACDWGWVVCPQSGALGLGPASRNHLWEVLLRPPCTFFAAVRTSGGPPVKLELQRANDNAVVESQTPLWLTLDNRGVQYTVYELEQTGRQTEGLAGGVRLLIDALGPVPPGLLPHYEEGEKDRGPRRGRPPMSNDAREMGGRAIVRRSGAG